jgi:hypothetical protein
MSERLRDIGWIVAFLALCAAWISEVTRATHRAELAAQSQGSGWVCPIAGKCGPAGTSGLGRW